jgi:hypothetical protein
MAAGIPSARAVAAAVWVDVHRHACLSLNDAVTTRNRPSMLNQRLVIMTSRGRLRGSVVTVTDHSFRSDRRQ